MIGINCYKFTSLKMRIAYVYDINNQGTVAGKTIARGFQNAFIDKQHQFKFFNMELFKRKSRTEILKLVLYNPHIIFTSIENIAYLPLRFLFETKLVLWGQFFSPCDYEPQIHTISEETKRIVFKYRDRHEMLVWSQHDEDINESFFKGYRQELGVNFIQLLHAADRSTCMKPLDTFDYDFLWIGNIGHRRDRYDKWISSLKDRYTHFIEYNEHNMVAPIVIENDQLYRRSSFAPNIHSTAQVENKILINERVFTSSIMGGFQICDNPLVRKYFTEEELIIANSPDEMLEIVEYYKRNSALRSRMITNMTAKIIQNHTYHNRVDTILSQFNC